MKLKTCPFCGGTARIQSDLWPRFVYCESCNARTANITDFGDDGINKAALAWNRRENESRINIPPISIEWLGMIRKDDRLTLDDIELIDWIISEWCSRKFDDSHLKHNS